MIDWLLPALAYVAALSALGVATKIALRTLTWPVLIVCTALAYAATSVALLIAGLELQLEPAVWWALLAGILAVTGLAVFYIALEQGPAGIVVPITAGYPLAGALLAAIVLSENISLARAVGMTLVVAGLVVLGREAPAG